MTGTVHVCWSPLSPDASDVEWLDPIERGRFNGLQRLEDRRRFVTSRALLKTVVGRLAEVSPALVHLSYDCTWCGRPHGRPVVIGPAAAVGWHVSLSHAGRQVMVAVTDSGPVGVDVEIVSATGFHGFDDVALTPAERREVEGRPPESRSWARAVYWTRKEAVLKATGYGLTVDPAALEVSAPNGPAALTAWLTDEPLVAPAQIADVPMNDGPMTDGRVADCRVNHEHVLEEHVDQVPIGDSHVDDSHVDDDPDHDDEHDHAAAVAAVAAVAILAHAPFELVLHSPPGSGWGQAW